MKDLAALLFGLGIINICCGGLAGIIDQDKWAKAFTIAAIILIVSAFLILYITI